jgi:hypothetical protein
MSLCPWCKATVPSAATNCPKCGKDPVDHPSISGAGFSNLGAFDDLDDAPHGLDLASSSNPAAADPAVGYGDDKFNDGFDDEEQQSGLQIEVETVHKQSSSQPATASACAPPAGGRPGVQSSSLSNSPSAPSGPPPVDSFNPALDPYEISILADFGTPPSALWMCPSYAIRVLRRKRQLNQMLRTAQKNAGEAERVRDDQLAAIAERVRGSLDADREMAGYLGPLARTEEVAREREKALSTRSAEYSSIVGAIDQKIAAEESRASDVKVRLDAARQDNDGKSQTVSRVQVQLKRAEIELRNAQEVARAAAGPEARTALPEHAEAILAAQKIVELRRQEIAGPKAQADASLLVLREVEGQAAEIERRINSLRTERRRAESTFTREMGVRSEGVELALTERRTALIAIGGRLFDTNSELIPQADYDEFHRVRSDVSLRQLEIERMMRALASADPSAVKKGWIAIAVGALLVLAIIALTISRLPAG